MTDDGGELNMQLNAMMYDQEETISGTVRHGVTGVLGQLNKARGAEPSARYIADGAWDPTIRCQPFYDRYLGRLFGPAARETLVRAYLLLEENERTLGWHGRHDLFGTYHHGNRMGVGLRNVDYKEERPKLDRPQVATAIQAADGDREFWDGRAAHCRQALALLQQARPIVLPGSRGAGLRDLQDRELHHGLRGNRRRGRGTGRVRPGLVGHECGSRSRGGQTVGANARRRSNGRTGWSMRPPGK